MTRPTFHFLGAGHYEFHAGDAIYTCEETRDPDGGYDLYLRDELILEDVRSPEAAFAWLEAELLEGAGR